MKETEFNLLEEPWIRVMEEDCTVRECSLTQALLDSHRYRCLANELPTLDVAILRLLLAVLQTVFYRTDPDGEDDPIENQGAAYYRWKLLWSAGRLPEEPIRDYLEKHRDRFWLFHPEYPFYQVPEARAGTYYTAAKLCGELSESSNKLRLFPVRSGECKAALSYAEAARWLLYVNGFDDMSSKPKGKGLPSLGIGWLGQLGLIYAEGSSLFETLMLNLVLREPLKEPKPIWEQPLRREERVEIAVPDNQAELLTLQSRRLFLERKDGMISGYYLLGGDFFPKKNAIAEQMTMWDRRDGKKNEPPYDQPRLLGSDRQMWRDFGIITGAGSTGRVPGVVSWISELKAKRLLRRDRVIRFRTAGIEYGAQNSAVEDILSDHLDFHAGLLDEGGKLWAELVSKKVEQTEKGAWLLGKLAEGIFKAEGGHPGSDAQSARYHKAVQSYYAAVDIPFRRWLGLLDPEQGDGEELRAEKDAQWRQEAYRIALEQGKQLVRGAGSAAFTGRWIKDKKLDQEIFFSSSGEFNRFAGSIRKCFDIPKTETGGSQ